MSFLWTGKDLNAALKGEVYGDLPQTINGISIDSRTLSPGDAFFAISGERFDGHDFVQNAAKAGAGALIVAADKAQSARALGVPLIIVDDVLESLCRLGAAARARSNAKIIAVTGSVGKTTTKEALRHVLAPLGRVHANPASFNNHWGVPLTLARMPQDTDFAIFEIGMNHENEIRPLVKLVRPQIVIITRIAAAHLGYFASVEAIADAKAEIFEGLEPGGTALLNSDDPLFSYLHDKAKEAGVSHIATFGEAGDSDYRLDEVRLHADCSCFGANLAGEEAMIKIGAPGRHMVQNALAVLGCADLIGADIARVALALQGFSAESGRGAQHRLSLPSGGTITLIDESYNANPASIRAALQLLEAAEPGPRGRRIAILGDMLELGRFSESSHAGLAEPVRNAGANPVFLVGTQMKYLADALGDDVQLVARKTVDELLPLVMQELRAGDVIMVKSSKSIGSSRIVSALLDRFEPTKS